MFKIFLLIFILRDISADDEESNEKYIDLLPEEEKQEFLNRIARRILGEIKSSDTPHESQTDVADEQLDAHNTYIQEILKEESQNLETEKMRRLNKESNENDSDHVNKKEHIDLTLRAGQRLKRRNNDQNLLLTTVSEPPYDVIPVQAIYDENPIDGIKNDSKEAIFPTKNSITSGNEGQDNLTDDNLLITDQSETLTTIPTEAVSIILNIFNSTLKSTNNDENFRKAYNNDNYRSTVIADFEPSTDENTTTTENIEYSTTPIQQQGLNNSQSHEVTWGQTQKIYKEDNSDENSSETTTLVDDVINHSTISTSTTFSNSILNTEVDDDESTTTSYTENITIPDIPTNKTRKKISDEFSHNETDTDEKAILIMEGTKTEELVSITNNSKSEINLTTPSNLAENNKQYFVKVTSVSNNTLVNTNNVTTPKTEQNIQLNEDKLADQEKYNSSKTNLRVRADMLNENQMDEISFFKKNNENTPEAYEIYEVDSKKPQFISTNEKKYHEHPYYVPIYNYASDNAYYKPFNKYGPNVQHSSENEIIYEDVKEDDLKHFDFPNARHRFFGYNKEKFNSRLGKNSNKKRSKILSKFMQPIPQSLINTNIYYNPYDYQDMDYYFGRILRKGNEGEYIDDNSYTNYKHFADSNEPDHLVSSINSSETIKDQVEAIRKLLYLHKIFSYVPEALIKRGRKAYSNPKVKINHIKVDPRGTLGTENRPQEDSISMDYYFGRNDPNKPLAKNRAFRNNESLNSLLKVNHNIFPLTPSPLNFVLSEKNIKSKVNQADLNNKMHADSLPNHRQITFKQLFKGMLAVLDDFIRFDNEGLVKYDWLKTTVNIQAGLGKLLDLISQLKTGKSIHPKDAELLKYLLFLFKSSQISLNYDNTKLIYSDVRRMKAKHNKIVPQSKKKNRIKQPLKVWKEYASYIRSRDVGTENKMKLLNDFEDVVKSLLFYLNDFHDTIKHIAMITNYKNQSWYKDLKDVFLNKADSRKLAQVALHLSLSKLLDFVEDSSGKGVEDNFMLYLQENKEDVKRSKAESIFVMSVFEELKRLNNS